MSRATSKRRTKKRGGSKRFTQRAGYNYSNPTKKVRKTRRTKDVAGKASSSKSRRRTSGPRRSKRKTISHRSRRRSRR